MGEADGDDLLDHYISDESESDYWARRMGRRVQGPGLVRPDRCLFPSSDWETEVYWYRPDLSQGGTVQLHHLLQLASRVLTFFKAWRLRRDGGCEERGAERGLCEKCLGCDRRVTAENVENYLAMVTGKRKASDI